MPSTAEILMHRHLPQNPEGYNIHKLEGGVTSESYKVQLANQNSDIEPVVFTLYRDPSDWWKVDKEIEIRRLSEDDPDVLIPEIYDAGFDTLEGEQFAYLMRQYITGDDIHTVIETNFSNEFRQSGIKHLAHDIGFRFAAIHRHNASLYGMICNNEDSHYNSWEVYVMRLLENEISLISKLPSDKKIGRVTVDDLMEKLPHLESVVGSNQSSLQLIDGSSLSHGDAHFGNIIADNDNQGTFKVKSIIDFEDAVGGDPEIDIAFIENWLHIFPYKSAFYDNADHFRLGYEIARKPTIGYEQRRLIYHTVRSLSYLRTVLEFDSAHFLKDHPRGEVYVERHMQIIESLASGGKLEDINLKPLL